MRTFILCFLLALPVVPAMGVEPYLVKDIDPVAAPAGSEPAHLVTFRDAVLFFADDGLSGRRLWRTGGTGTFPLSDTGFADPQPFAVTERLYFFVSAHPLRIGGELWVTDGTPAGTLRLTDPGVRVEHVTRAWAAGVLYFVADDSVHGPELWRTDGTPRGTRLVADIYPGGGSSQISELTAWQGRAWFIADDGRHGGALWRSNGSAAGTVLAVDPVPSSSSHPPPDHLRVVGNRLTFVAVGGGLNFQLWAGDGTAQGTRPVTGFRRKALLSPVVHANRLWFAAADGQTLQLWVSDGTGRGTRRLFEMPFDHFSYGLRAEQGLRGLFLFLGFDPDHGFEPWITDGTPQGTRLLRDVCPGPCSSAPQPVKTFQGRLYFVALEPDGGDRLWSTDGTPEGTRRMSGARVERRWGSGFFIVGDRLLFTAEDGEAGWEVWQTDGTEAGTVPVTDFQGLPWNEQEGIHGAVLNGELYFNADDGVHGSELWNTDGLVADINQTDLGGSFPTALRPMGNQVVFVVQKDLELWRSDGTAEGTVLIRAFGPEEADGARPTEVFAEAGGMLFYFASSTGGDFVPWRTDGTAAGTFRLTEEGVPGCCRLPEMEAVGSTVFFGLRDEEHGRELWASDGTREGTRRVRDLVPGVHDSEPADLTAFQGRLYFTAGPAPTDRRLWTSDGTEAGTVPVLDLNTGSARALFTVHAGRLWFFADGGGGQGRELWSTDGTAAGTRLEVEFVPGPGSFLATSMNSLGDRLVVSFNHGGTWVTDGTSGGTVKIDEGEIEAFGSPRVVFHGRLYFVSLDTFALWVSAGTQTGTRLFLDREGREIYGTSRMEVLGDRLVFNAADSSGNLVLWESDGFPSGTFQVEPRVEIGSPLELVRAGDRVFFPSYDPATGWELWAVRP